jgi:hypothetical protein
VGGIIAAVLIAGIKETRQAQLTFAKPRPAIVDLTQVFITSPWPLALDRLPPAGLTRLREVLADAGVTLQDDLATVQRLAGLRQTYEPHVHALSGDL